MASAILTQGLSGEADIQAAILPTQHTVYSACMFKSALHCLEVNLLVNTHWS